MKRLFLFLFLTACHGGDGDECYGNKTCDDGFVCVFWDNHDICAPTDKLNIGGFMAPKCPPCPVVDAGVITRCPWR
jgi:hypothetical protein